jgi:hypothetical protein
MNCFAIRLAVIGLSLCISKASPATGPSIQACRGWIAVESTPVSGARIRLDGEETGFVTPATLKNVSCGVHTVEGAKTHYRYSGFSSMEEKPQEASSRPLSKQARVKVGNDTVTMVKLRFRANFGSVEIATVPPGARIEVDGKKVGTSPLFIPKLAPGKHTLGSSLPDHRPASRRFVVKVGKRTGLRVKLKPAFGRIEVSAGPEKEAMVYFNGDSVGHAPVTLNRIWSGTHTVRVVKDNHQPFETKINLRDGGKVHVAAVLKPHLGGLMIDTLPFAAEIELDTKRIGRAPLSLKRVEAGAHVITARGDGHSPLTRRVEVRGNRITMVEMNLAQPGKSRHRVSGAPDKESAAGSSTGELEPTSPVPPDFRPGSEPNTSTDPSSALTLEATAPRPSSWRETLAWGAAAVAAGAAVSAVTFFALGSSSDDQAGSLVIDLGKEADYQRRRQIQALIRDLESQARTRHTVAWICTSAAVAAAGASLYLFLARSPSDPEGAGRTTALRASPLLGGVFLGFETSF